MLPIPPSEQLGRVVRGRRVEIGLKRLKDFSQRLGPGWSVPTVRRLESGTRGINNEGEFLGLAKVLEMSPEELRERLQRALPVTIGGHGNEPRFDSRTLRIVIGLIPIDQLLELKAIVDELVGTGRPDGPPGNPGEVRAVPAGNSSR